MLDRRPGVQLCWYVVRENAVVQANGWDQLNHSSNGGDVGAKKVNLRELERSASGLAPVYAFLLQPSLHSFGSGLWDGTKARQCCEQIMDTKVQ